MPRSREARRYRNVAHQRLEDVRFLLDNGRTNGAIYLAGYAVECGLKALILESRPRSQAADLVKQLRGPKGHDYDWLRSLYRDLEGPAVPDRVRDRFLRINTWSVELRYSDRRIGQKDAHAFVSAVVEIWEWIENRLGP